MGINLVQTSAALKFIDADSNTLFTIESGATIATSASVAAVEDSVSALTVRVDTLSAASTSFIAQPAVKVVANVSALPVAPAVGTIVFITGSNELAVAASAGWRVASTSAMGV